MTGAWWRPWPPPKLTEWAAIRLRDIGDRGHHGEGRGCVNDAGGEVIQNGAGLACFDTKSECLGPDGAGCSP